MSHYPIIMRIGNTFINLHHVREMKIVNYPSADKTELKIYYDPNQVESIPLPKGKVWHIGEAINDILKNAGAVYELEI